MPDAGALDPRRELAADLLGELSSDLVAEEGGDVFGFDGQDGLPRKLFIEGFEDGWRAEHQISGVSTGSARRPSPTPSRPTTCIASSTTMPSSAVRCSTSSPSPTTGV